MLQLLAALFGLWVDNITNCFDHTIILKQIHVMNAMIMVSLKWIMSVACPSQTRFTTLLAYLSTSLLPILCHWSSNLRKVLTVFENLRCTNTCTVEAMCGVIWMQLLLLNTVFFRVKFVKNKLLVYLVLPNRSTECMLMMIVNHRNVNQRQSIQHHMHTLYKRWVWLVKGHQIQAFVQRYFERKFQSRNLCNLATNRQINTLHLFLFNKTRK